MKLSTVKDRLFWVGFMEGFSPAGLIAKPPKFKYNKTERDLMSESWQSVGLAMYCSIGRHEKRKQKKTQRK
jgi:hypothetical protein